jgi:hypothetical protein
VTVTEDPDGYTAGFSTSGNIAASESTVENGKKFELTGAAGTLAVTNTLDSSVLTVTKEVTGEYGDQTKDFVFTVKVTLPKLSKNFDFTATGHVPTVTADKGSISGTWADGENVTVNLKHGGQLNFPELPVGTKIEVSEAAFENYTPNYIAKHSANADKTGAVEISSNNSKAETALATAETIVVGEFGANVQYTNKYDAVTPTGIIINNLPYILLIALALGGIVLFTRKKRYE